MYKCIVIDDELHALEGVVDYIKTMPEMKLIASYSDPLVALRTILASDPVDLILMDVDMPKITGIELAREIRTKTKKLVFTTAHSKYAYEAFGVDADDFLLKPYSLGKFVITMNKLFPSMEKTNKVEVTKDFFFVKSKEDNLKLIKVRFNDIIAVESNQNYIYIHTTTRKIFTYMTLAEIGKILLAMPMFIQIQRSFIINTNHIEYVDGNSVKLDKGLGITVGFNYRKDFNSFLAETMIKMGKKIDPPF